jgi:hypothetical protein
MFALVGVAIIPPHVILSDDIQNWLEFSPDNAAMPLNSNGEGEARECIAFHIFSIMRLHCQLC